MAWRSGRLLRTVAVACPHACSLSSICGHWVPRNTSKLAEASPNWPGLARSLAASRVGREHRQRREHPRWGAPPAGSDRQQAAISKAADRCGWSVHGPRRTEDDLVRAAVLACGVTWLAGWRSCKAAAEPLRKECAAVRGVRQPTAKHASQPSEPWEPQEIQDSRNRQVEHGGSRLSSAAILMGLHMCIRHALAVFGHVELFV
ncbi:uncharacterized protein THITE_113949 [Thermothielavioides terrestris NRRL 8126]|uniref:Uncharacterized protein n=1 Tax=Thermothielavioides terrestris (strain ATCC 38088 / NRRL 8126) TaxID=578455 RepID=G2RBV6_THETT|nr:uncharacterized protein THITE_113949 [Thermothielavioides terrestris NRRL 8126]AEO69277.1 hypothetical protein THITE_113949 [Thermothielavioides terrestris NRRL 8126]